MSTQYMFQLELLHDGKAAEENEQVFQHFAAHLGMDGHVRGGGVGQTERMAQNSASALEKNCLQDIR